MREVNFTSKFKRDLRRELKSNNNKNVEALLDFVIK
jgi:mRNA-degrading endonuclease YafQ of YafQ-DinJ toxin-antitoxin module